MTLTTHHVGKIKYDTIHTQFRRRMREKQRNMVVVIMMMAFGMVKKKCHRGRKEG